jgi:hypothetical protein
LFKVEREDSRRHAARVVRLQKMLRFDAREADWTPGVGAARSLGAGTAAWSSVPTTGTWVASVPVFSNSKNASGDGHLAFDA